MSEAVEVKVRCQHQLHRIRLTRQGKLVLCDHEEPTEQIVDAAIAAGKAGFRAIRCGRVMLAWRCLLEDVPMSFLLMHLPPVLHSAYREAFARQRTRRTARNDDLESLSLLERMKARTVAAAEKALETASYRRSQDRWVDGSHVIRAHVASTTWAKGWCQKTKTAKRKWPGSASHLSVGVRRNWLIQVAREGLAVVDGQFILEVLDRTPARLIVRAVRQGRGFSVRVAIATVKPDADGWYLTWKR